MTAQALPDQYPGLQQLYQMAPLMAFAQAGDQQRIADENNPRLQQAFDQDFNQQNVMNPLNAAFRGGQVDHQAAQTRMLQSQTNGFDLSNAFTGATQPGKIQATNSDNRLKTTKDTADTLEEQGRVFGQIATRLKDKSPWEQAAIIHEEAGDALPKDSLFMQRMLQHPDLPGHLENLSADAYAKSSASRKAAAAEDLATKKLVLQGENALELERLRQEGKFDMANLKMTLQPKKDENMSQWEARMRAAAQSGDIQAQLALQNMEAYGLEKARASAATGDALRRELLTMTPKTNLSQPTPRTYAPGSAPANPQTQFPVRNGPANYQEPPVSDKVRIMQNEYLNEKNPADKEAIRKTMMREGVPMPDAPASPAAPANNILPQGTKDNGDGTFTLPDGRRIRRKQ